jgi:short subunit dehydrogenase-like uncharacterized protein
MLEACLDASAHYLDITGEIPVYQMVFGYDAAAQARGIALLPGVGFDVVPSDCLLKYVAERLPDATHLEIAVDALGLGAGVSAGTTKSMLELMPTLGNVARRDGRLVNIPFGRGARWFDFPGGRRLAMPAPWGDVEMGCRSTGIPNITAYLTFPPAAVRLFGLTGGLLPVVLKSAAVRAFLSQQIDRIMTGPSEQARNTARSQIYARAWNDRAEAAAWLETVEAYRFTAEAGVRVVERVLDGGCRGALTPSLAFGADFALDIPGTRRFDTLPPPRN